MSDDRRRLGHDAVEIAVFRDDLNAFDDVFSRNCDGHIESLEQVASPWSNLARQPRFIDPPGRIFA
jgi:hypothetical protein